jgi:hypothetical protein
MAQKKKPTGFGPSATPAEPLSLLAIMPEHGQED